MKKLLQIGHDFTLPLDAITQTLVVYGGKGMGKTNFAAVFVEELYKQGLKFSVLDPLGVNWGLQHGRTREAPGLKIVILGGIHGDIPIEPTAGAVVADFVADEDISTVVDISRKPSGAMWSFGDRIRFVRDYCYRLFERQGERRFPLMQVIDEAGRFVPQTIPARAENLAECVGSIEQLVEWGRNVGIGVTLITQRSARMNKSVSELAECMIAFRTIGPNSVDAVMDWMGEHVEKDRLKELVEEVRKLKRGTALVVSPGWLQFEGVADIRMRETFDSSKTPEPGVEPRAPGKAAKPDLNAYLDRMKETVEKAKSEDPKELRKQIVALKQEIVALKHGSAAPAVDVTEVRRLQAEIREREKQWTETLTTKNRIISDVERKLANIAGIVNAHLAKGVADDVPPPPKYDPKRAEPATRVISPARPARRSNSHAETDSDMKLAGGPRKILTALAQYPNGKPKVQLAILAGYAHSGGGFNNYLGALRTAGYVFGDQNLLKITDAGLNALGDFEPLPTGVELQNYWKAQLGGAQLAIFNYLLEHPDPITKEELAAATGYEARGGGFNNALGRLRTLELIQGYGAIQPADVLFEEFA